MKEKSSDKSIKHELVDLICDFEADTGEVPSEIVVVATSEEFVKIMQNMMEELDEEDEDYVGRPKIFGIEIVHSAVEDMEGSYFYLRG